MTSEQLTEILNMFRNVIPHYNYSYDKVGELDLLTQDYLHKLELVDLPYNERSKLATKLRKVRLERRKHKDIVERLEPLVKTVNKESKSLKSFEQTLGTMRKIEDRQQIRTYNPRVLDEDEFGEIMKEGENE